MATNHYYATKDALGARGDFLTAPETSQLFGEMLGLWVACKVKQENLESFNLVELGPGNGTLMLDLLRATKSIRGVHENILEVSLVEISDRLRRKQKERLMAYPGLEIQWYNHIDEITPKGSCIVIANEFFDALPIRQYIKIGDKTSEIVVASKGSDFIFKQMPVKDLALSKTLKEGINEISKARTDYARAIAKMIRKYRGSGTIIDYGYFKPPMKSTLQAVKKHEKLASVFEEIGNADVTSLVDFWALKNVCEECKLKTRPLTQKQFLLEHGILKRAETLIAHGANESNMSFQLEQLLSKEAMGERFKVLICSNSA